MELNKKPLIRIENLKMHFPLKKKSIFQREQLSVKAVDGITVDIFEGETLGLVGESGCGKSTLGRTILQLYNQTEGSTLYYGRSLADFAPAYVKDIIKGLSSNYPKYLAAKKELAKLRAEIEAETDEKKQFRLQSKLHHDTIAFDNNYRNILRIAGGLLTHSDLGEVTSKLADLHLKRMKLASLTRKELELRTSLATPEILENSSAKNKLETQLTKISAQLTEATSAAEVAEKAVETLRQSCQGNPNFAEYEAELDEGIDLAQLTKEEMRVLRRDVQLIFQDPYSSLNPRLTVGQIIGEGLLAHDVFKSPNSEAYTEYITDIMDKCGLSSYFIHRFPHQFSGGQRQRIGIARALALNPKFLVCDEAVSALDVSIQSQIINLLIDLKKENNLTYLFITHDLSVVKFISDRIGVMYLGNLVELASSDQLFSKPLHPYTEALMEAIPRTDVDANQQLSILEGDIPSSINPPKGCKFHTRCKYAFDKCREVEPAWLEKEPGHFVACHLWDE